MSDDVLILKSGMFTVDGGQARLLISRCKVCNTAFFPQRPYCSYCASDQTEVVSVSDGKLRNFTCVYHPSPESRMPVPYGMAVVEFPEYSIRITGLCTEHDVSKLRRGMDVKVVVEKVYEEDGKDVVMYKFQSVGEGA